MFKSSISALVQVGSDHALSESMRSGSCKQPEYTIKEAPDTITGTTDKAEPKGVGAERAGIADHLVFTLFRPLGDVE